MTEVRTILLVDDDQEDREIFEEAVNEINGTVSCICVDTAEAALQTLQSASQKPDFIFLDLNLPFMDGFECLVKLKKRNDLQHIPVVIYSTSSRQSDKQKAKELGASNYLSKTSTFSELKTMLANVIH